MVCPVALAHVNIGVSEQIVGNPNNAVTVHNNFITLTTTHAAKISSISLSNQEWQMLAWRNPGLEAMLTTSAARSKYVAARNKGPIIPVPPTLGGLGALDSTITEIFLDFRLFGGPLYGPLSAEAAAYATGMYLSATIGAAAIAGYTAGTVFANWLQAYDPAEWSLVVDDVGYLIQGINALVSYADAGKDFLFGWQSWQLNETVFGLPSYDLGIGSSYGYGDSFGFGLFDDITSFDVTGSCFNPGDC